MDRSIIFQPLEPQAFKGPGELAPIAKGPYAVARSTPLPPPTLLTGALATYMAMQRGIDVGRVRGMTWLEGQRMLLKLEANAKVKGPYAIGPHRIAVQLGRSLVWLDELEALTISMHRQLTSKEGFLSSWSQVMKAETPLLKVEVPRQVRVGIALRTRLEGSKVTRKGMIYQRDYLDYLTVSLSIAIDVCGFPDAIEVVDGGIVALSERRLSRLKLGQAELSTWVTRELEEWRGAYEDTLLYVASPVALTTSPQAKETLLNQVETLLGIKDVMVIGRLSAAPIGYSLAINSWKPVYAILEPGSAILAQGASEIGLLKKAFEEGLGEDELRSMGWGTIIPIPIPHQPKQISGFKIERDPDKLGGKPVIRGTRIPVQQIVNELKAGVSLEQIVEEYNLSREEVIDAEKYWRRWRGLT